MIPYHNGKPHGGLRFLWALLKRIAGVAMMAAACAAVGGIVFALLTIFVYMIGLAVGVPLGTAVGVALGIRMRPRDSCIVFTSGLVTFLALEASRRPMEPSFDEMVSRGVPYGGAVGAIVLTGLLTQVLPPRLRYYLAVGCACVCGVLLVVAVQRITTIASG